MTNNWVKASLIVLASTVTWPVAAQPASEPPQPAQPAPGMEPAPPDPQRYTEPQYATPPPPQTMAPQTAPPQTSPPPPQYLPPQYDVPPPSRRYRTAEPQAGEFTLGFAWNLAFPVGSVTDFTSEVSAYGFEIPFRYWVQRHVAIGADVDWQTLVDDRPRTTRDYGDGAITATAYDTVQMGAVRAAAEYSFLENGHALPFIGADIGYAWSTFQTAAADITLYDNQDSVILGGRLGILFALAPDSPRFILSGKYSYQPSAEFLSVNDVQTVAIQIGMTSPGMQP
jgi:hypothetical protein